MRFRLTALMAGLAMTNLAMAATPIDLRHQHQLNTDSNKVKFERIRSSTDFNGTQHTRIQQTYAGIPVWNATGVIHTPKTSLRAMTASMNGKVYAGLEKDLSNAPAFALSANQMQKAVQIAKQQHIKHAGLKANAFENEKSKPIIFIDENKQAHYAFLVSFTYVDSTGMHKPTSIVDAVTNKIHRSWEGILTAMTKEQALAHAKAKFSAKLRGDDMPEMYDTIGGGIGGNPKTGPLSYDNQNGHQKAFNIKAVDFDVEILPGKTTTLTLCALMNDDIVVLDTSLGGEVVADICSNTTKAYPDISWLSLDAGLTRWKADEMNEGLSPSLDAFNAAVTIKNFYQDWYNVPALIDSEGNPMKYVLRVHFGRSFDNAFWDGQQMTFGDGGKMFYPMSSIGVTAHEISHGFTDTHSHIDYSYPEMGALHESFSDMAAVTVENYLTGSNHWDIGREVKKDEGALRYLDNPTKDGHSIDHMKDFDQTEAHSGAGVTNKAFYLLATTKGWDTRKAFNVWVKANVDYWDSSMSTLAEAACGVVAATNDYQYNVADVRIAFAKVGIDTDQCS